MNKLYNDTAVQAIANAIRAKNGSTDTYTIAEMSTALNDLSYYAKPTISNIPLATFEADGLPLNSLKVSVEAQQDLHGYDKPWVGGAGKNKLNSTGTTTVGGLTFTSDSDYYITVSPNNRDPRTWTYEKCQWFLTLPAGDYKISWEVKTPPTPSAQGIGVYDSENNPIASSLFATTFASNGYIDFTLTEEKSLGVLTKLYDGSVRFMVCSATAPNPTTFAPYSNICPISGWDNAIVTDTDDVDNPTVTQTTTISLGQTVYGGEVDVVNGILKITDGYIASYNGETLPSTWISSMDEYVEGTTPTTGAEVVYTLASSTTVSITPTLIKSLNGTNNLSVDCGDVIELEYFKEV